jgi:hypothetical protein
MEDVFIRGWTDFVARTEGPMKLRFVLQPTVATLLALRAGLADARQGNPAFLWGVLFHPERRGELLRKVRDDCGKIFCVALVLDAIYQLIVHRGIYALELVFTAATLALVPYVLVRGPVNRIARLALGHNKELI